MTGQSGVTVLCAGTMAGVAHQGGATWAVLQYLLGFKQLGHTVFFVEPVPRSKLRPVSAGLADTDTAADFQRLMISFGMLDSSALLLEGTTDTVGLDYEALRRVAARADVLVNLSGVLSDPALLEPIESRLYLDLDPGFNQAWHTNEGIDRHFDAHTHFATVGLAMGTPECRVPTCDRTWITTCPPVVLREWPVARALTHNAFTTVANWRSYGSVYHDGLFLGQKAHALRPLMDLPQRTHTQFELALSIHPAEPDLNALQRHGWKLLDPVVAAGTPGSYRKFVGGSRAEFGLAKSGYIAARSGWVSDRSACYLASGRPVLAQDTGFAAALPTGEGLLRFETHDEAVAGVESIETSYERHRAAARAIAEMHFDSDRVLTRLLDQVVLS